MPAFLTQSFQKAFTEKSSTNSPLHCSDFGNGMFCKHALVYGSCGTRLDASVSHIHNATQRGRPLGQTARPTGFFQKLF